MWSSGEISLAYLTVDGALPAEHIDAAKAAGFDAAGLRILPPTHLGKDLSVVGDADAIRSVARACEDAGIRPLDAEVLTLTSTTSREPMAAFVGAAAEIGFRFVQTVIEDTDDTRAADNLGRLAELARAVGVGVALEFMAFRPLSTLDRAVRVLERSGADNAGLIIDALHLYRAGGTAADIAALPPQCLAIAQLCDAPRTPPPFDDLATEARTSRLHPGEGSLPLAELLDALPDGLPLSLEVPHPAFSGSPYEERAVQSMAALRRFLDERRERSGD